MEDIEVKEILREEFFRDWIENASQQQIIEKLIQNDERAKQIKELEKQLEECIQKSKAEEMLEEIDEELEEMKVDNMYGRYDDYGGKRKFNEQFSYKFGEKEILQELLED